MGQSIKTWLTIVAFYLHAYFSLANEQGYLCMLITGDVIP